MFSGSMITLTCKSLWTSSSWNSVQNGFQFKSTRDRTEHSNPLHLVQVYKCIRVNLEDCKAGPAIASYFKIFPQTLLDTTCGCTLRPHILLILDAKRSLLMQFSGPKSHMFCNSYQTISIVAATVLSVRQQIVHNLDSVHACKLRAICYAYILATYMPWGMPRSIASYL